jgi:hypothetical protein
VSVCVVFFVLLQKKNIAQKPVEGRETVEEAFSCTPPEIVSAAKEPECTLPEHGLLSKNCNYCTFNVNLGQIKQYVVVIVAIVKKIVCVLRAQMHNVNFEK